ncbi:MAG: hypothetical protein ACFFDT_01890 [Candidatus Hodarchaeota archaeon]
MSNRVAFLVKNYMSFRSRLPSYLILMAIIILCGCIQLPDSALLLTTEGETTLGPKASGGEMFSVEENNTFVEITCLI